MKFRFKVQAFQTEAVEAVADCFQGQPLDSGLRYRIDPGRDTKGQTARLEMDEGFRNAELALPLPPFSRTSRPSKSAKTSRLRRAEADSSVRCESRHRDGDRHWQDLLLHQDHLRAEPALRLEQVHHRRAEHRHP